MNVKKRIKYFVTTLFAFVIAVIISGQGFLSAFLQPKNVLAGNETIYTDVLDDLHKDRDFNENIYPNVIKDNYPLEVITIAESVDYDLLVYVYQPCDGYAKDYYATKIKIAFAEGDNSDISTKSEFKLYDLEYLTNNGVFYKYRVKGLSASKKIQRVYEITSIYRKFNEILGDEKPEDDNTIDYVDFDVCKQFKFVRDATGESSIIVRDIETIAVTSKYLGYLQYVDSWLFSGTGCDVHFFAFSTSRTIDDLLEAEISYKWHYKYWSVYANGNISIHNEKTGSEIVILKKNESFSHVSSGWFSKKAQYQQILPAAAFVSNHTVEGVFYSNVLTDEAIENICKQNWVLTYAAYPYMKFKGSGKDSDRDYYEKTFVSEVTLVRLKFITDGIEYNLGVLDNIKTGSNNPVNEENFGLNFDSEFKFLIGLILGLVLIVVLWPFISPVIIWLIKFMFNILLFPFKLIFKKRRKRK